MSDRTPANDNDGPMVTLTRRELETLVTRAVCEALDRGIGGPVLVDKQDLARQLGCSPSSVDRLRREGLPSVQLSPQVVRFEPAKVIEWLKEHKQHA
jgi:predicted DNA-binding transcriptional regulator AlpA